MKLSVTEAQTISLEILKRVTDICEKLNLRYYLMYGTLIGAIRHNGYIPWDDDTDIMMPREDHDVLLNYLKNNSDELKGLEIYTPKINREYPYMITRISNPKYKLAMKNEYSYGMGIFIDIYPFDGLGRDFSKALGVEKKGDYLSSFCYLSTRKHYAFESTKGIYRNILKLPLFIIARLIGKDFFQRKLQALEYYKPYDKSKYICCVVWASGGAKDIFQRSWFNDFKYHKFEQYKFRIPINYDAVLRHAYGDYMKLPPKSKRIGHHFYEVVVNNEK